MTNPDTFIIADSDATEAEYGCRSDSPVTVLQFYNDEIANWFGFSTIAAAKATLIADGNVAAQISYL